MKRKTLAILLLAAPIPLLVIILSVYAIMSFILASLITPAAHPSSIILFLGVIVRLFLSFVGLVAVLGVPFGMPVGIYLLLTPEKNPKI